MTSSPDFELAFGKVNYCDICGDSNFMCECKFDVPDFDTYEDEDKY